MKPICLLAGLCMTLMIGVARADHAEVTVASQGETRLTATAGELSVQVKIRAHEVQIGKPSDPKPTVIESNCTYSKYPCSVVDRFEIAVNGASIFIPKSAFCDLADVRKAEIEAEDREPVLRLVGGDGAASFVVTIEFDKSRVTRRTRAGGESGGRLSEDTRYYQVVFD